MIQSTLKVSSAAVSDKGLSEKRPQNEDSFLCLEESGLYAVADGVGGAQAGDVASEMAVEILGEAFINLDKNGDAEDRMRQAIEQANAAIYQMSRELSQLSTMATTLVALHISGNIATIGHVGDSRLYRLDSEGLIFRETQDHSIVEEEVRAGRMTREQATVHPSRNVISRALGAENFVEIVMKTIMFETNSTFLVCSDGVTRHISDDELRELLLENHDPEKICRDIKDICFERGAEDNLTAVVVKAGAADGDAFERTDSAEEETETVATARAGASSGQLFADIPESGPSTVDTLDTGFELDDIDDLEDPETQDFQPKEDFRDLEDSTETEDSDDTLNLEDSEGRYDPDDSEDLEDTQDIVIPTREHPRTIPEPDAVKSTVASAGPSSDLDAVKDVRAYRVDDSSGSGILGRLLSGLVWLIVGLLIGAFGYYLYSTTAAVTTDDAAAQTNNSVLIFEQQRRLVDIDPARYLAAYSTKTVKTAGDNYLIGRAYLIQGNYGAAKTSFESALLQLDSADANNRSILEHDISAGLTIATSEEAQKKFEETGKEPADAEGVGTETPKGD